MTEEVTSRTYCTLRLLSTGFVFSRYILAISSLLTIHTKFNSNILQFAVFLFPYTVILFFKSTAPIDFITLIIHTRIDTMYLKTMDLKVLIKSGEVF